VEPVDVAVKRIDREGAAERVIVGEPEDVLEGRREKERVGLPDEVLETGPLLVGLGEDEELFERAELVVCVFDAVMLRVPVAVDVWVAERRPLTVPRGLLDGVFDAAAVAVKNPVGRIDFVNLELGDGRRVPISERVDVVVFVDVFDWVEVDVGAMPKSTSRRSWLEFHGLVATAPIDAKSSNHRMFLLQLHT
jgi:hypothetical protein